MEIVPTSSSSIVMEMKNINIDSKKIKIQVSNTKKPLIFYLNLAKKYIKVYKYVVLSALGMAIPTVITIAEILKNNGVALEKKVLTSSVGSKDETKGRMIQKPKIEILMERCENGEGDCSSDIEKVDNSESPESSSNITSSKITTQQQQESDKSNADVDADSTAEKEKEEVKMEKKNCDNQITLTS
ncbi:uncharacterized protein At2g34160-like [Impatiens glandulifera]|uniref:uncharacterized protein At2g34160-like n=1 Tax=Impatiens glandulifera TaxID=253017 RepID=UPI001FB0BA5D|nr:uncharacterized protein At2g34160-like [Impatiens glandulifera]